MWMNNEAGWDRGFRMIVGLGLLSLIFIGPQAWVVALAGLIGGLVLLVTGVSGFCPLYRLFGVSTCPVAS